MSFLSPKSTSTPGRKPAPVATPSGDHSGTAVYPMPQEKQPDPVFGFDTPEPVKET